MTLLIFGYGYTAQAFARRAQGRFRSMVGTVRKPEKAQALSGPAFALRVFNETQADPALAGDIAGATAALVSIPPEATGDPTLRRFEAELASATQLRWIGYLSTIGVYGDHRGGWVDEATPVSPASERSARRVEAERDWLAFGDRTGKAVQIFRLAGIYGPGQNALTNLAAGTARRIVKPGQVFNRIHVDDVAGALAASLDRPRPGAIYNVTDDEPGPPQDVVAYAASLVGAPVPPETPFANASLSPMARSFYGENKRVSNARLREELGYQLLYPTYREALQAMVAAGEGRRG